MKTFKRKELVKNTDDLSKLEKPGQPFCQVSWDLMGAVFVSGGSIEIALSVYRFSNFNVCY